MEQDVKRIALHHELAELGPLFIVLVAREGWIGQIVVLVGVHNVELCTERRRCEVN